MNRERKCTWSLRSVCTTILIILNYILKGIKSSTMKRKANNDGRRSMMEYRMRTPYAIPTPTNSSTPPPQQTTSRRHEAHEKSHAKQKPIEPSYHYENRVEKTYRTKKTNASSQGTVSTTTKKSACCTIL